MSAYVSRVRIERLGGPRRLAHLPAETQPVEFGMHGFHARLCPVARSLAGGIEIRIELRLT